MGKINRSVLLPTGVWLEVGGDDGETAARYGAALARAWPLVRHRPVRCGCRPGPLLTIRRRRDGAGQDSYHLARYPGTATAHGACVFHQAPAERTGRQGYTAEVIREQPDGDVTVRLGIPLISRAGDTAAEIPDPARPTPGGGGRARLAQMTPLGLLNLLWERASLDSWDETVALSDWQVANRLTRAAETIAVGRTGLDRSFLALPAAPGLWDRERLEALLAARSCRRAATTRHRCVIVAVSDGVDAERGLLRCTGAVRTDLFLNLPDAVAERLRQPGGISAVALEAARGDAAPPARCIAIAVAELRPRSQRGSVSAEVLDAALMPVTAQWIPYASSLEKVIADKLVAERRTFRKPLRYDADADTVFPDFELLDAGPASCPMEVFGRTDEAYEARKAEKVAYYRREYGATKWWCWIAAGLGRQAEPPPFPPRADAGLAGERAPIVGAAG